METRTPTVSVRRRLLSYRQWHWQEPEDSNPLLSALEADAAPCDIRLGTYGGPIGTRTLSPGVQNRRATYITISPLERHTRLELVTAGWKPAVLPLHQ